MVEFLLVVFLVSAIIVLGVVLIVMDMDTRPMSEIIKDTATETVKTYFESDAFKKTMQEVLEADPIYVWLRAMMDRFLEVDKSMSPNDAWELARSTTREYLKTEGIQFGHPDYAWDKDGARQVADEMEIDHWETAV